MTDVKFHILSGPPRSVSPSSHATEADGFVFLTGQFGRDLDDPAKPLPDGIRAQTERSLRNMSAYCRTKKETGTTRGWPQYSCALQQQQLENLIGHGLARPYRTVHVLAPTSCCPGSCVGHTVRLGMTATTVGGSFVQSLLDGGAVLAGNRSGIRPTLVCSR